MGRIELSRDGSLAVVVESESDAAQLRATIKASDGADEVAVQPGTVTLTAENPFNFIALWATDFTWSSGAMKVALDCLVPVAQSSVSLHRRSQSQLLRRLTEDVTSRTLKLPEPPSGPLGARRP